MKLITKKSTTNGIRHLINIEKNKLSKTNKLFKNISKGIKLFAGRSSLTGRITVRHKGSGNKKNYKFVKFNNKTSTSILISNNYDPFRNAFIALNFDLISKKFFNTINTNDNFPGTLLSCNTNPKILALGDKTQLKNIPTGSIINNISGNLKYSQYIRAAGTFGQILQKDLVNCKVKLPSNKIIKININNFATLGVVSNPLANKIVLGKAGKNRYLGIRPTVRGIAMNPVDHPHGGRTNGGCPSVTPWGKPALGKPTVKKKNESN